MRISSRVLSAAVGIAMAFGVAVIDAVPAVAVSANAKSAFINSLVNAAQLSQRKFGVPTSVSIAQAVIASDWGTSKPATLAKNYFDTPCTADMTAAQFAKLAEAQVGKPYVLGAEAAITQTDPPKFDCSELVQWLFGRSGNPITDLAASQYNVTKSVAKSASPAVGDLVFLRNNPARSNGIGHVAVLTKKLSSGDWEIIEARGRAAGVVSTTLSYWKHRSYYAGLRRYAKLVLADGTGVAASAASLYQTGCVTISSTSYAKFSSVSDSFAAHAAAVTSDSAYSAASAVINSIPKYVDAIANVEHPKDASGYAASINSLIAAYHLTDYDVVSFDLVLLSGSRGAKVTALQYLLLAAGRSIKTTGSYDAGTTSAVKKFQSANKLTTDGEAGPMTLAALFETLNYQATGSRVSALHSLLAAIGYQTTPSSTFGTETQAAVKDFQTTAGRTATGVVDANTWALLYMTLDPAPAPTVTGTAKVTQTLTAASAAWGPGAVSLAYQWYRNGAAISGANALSYTLQPADAGATITMSVTGTRPGYTSVSRRSAPTAAVVPAVLTSTAVPKVTGKPVAGQVLTADPGTWEPASVALGYQWFRGKSAIPGANAVTYQPQGADVGAKIKVTVTGTLAGYQPASKSSKATKAVAKGHLGATPVPTIGGTPKVGETLTAVPGEWSPAPVQLAYRWYRGKKAIARATKPVYVLQAADRGATLKVKVTSTTAGYYSVSKTSVASAKVASPNQIVAADAKISGTAKVGKTLKVTAGAWAPEKVKLSYRWYRGSKAISHATRTSYKLKSADKGKTITVKVRGTKSGYDTVTAKAAVKVK